MKTEMASMKGMEIRLNFKILSTSCLTRRTFFQQFETFSRVQSQSAVSTKAAVSKAASCMHTANLTAKTKHVDTAAYGFLLSSSFFFFFFFHSKKLAYES